MTAPNTALEEAILDYGALWVTITKAGTPPHTDYWHQGIDAARDRIITAALAIFYKGPTRPEGAPQRAIPLYTAPQPTPVPAVDAEGERETVCESLARRLLWIAFCWNDHNFDAAHITARRTAEACGITSFEQANEWLAAKSSASTPTPIAAAGGETK